MIRKQCGIAVNAAVQGTARRVTKLDGEWRLKLDPHNAGMAEQWAGQPLETGLSCPVPGCIQSVAALKEQYPSVVGMHNAYLGTAWLERTFAVPQLRPEDRAWIKLGGIAPAAHVWINGTYVGYHGSAPVSVKYSVGELLREDGDNRITVAIVEEDKGMLGGLRFGEMFWSGLYRSVELEIGGALRLEELFLVPDLANERLHISGRVYNDSEQDEQAEPAVLIVPWAEDGNESKRFEGQAAERLAVGAGDSTPFAFAVDVPGIKRWSCEQPNLYVASVQLRQRGAIVDEQRERFGMRSFAVEGAGLSWNGRPFLARGTGQEFFSPAICPLVDRDIIRSRFRSVIAHGFNFFRCHTYTPTPEELDIADELGLVLASEISLVSNFAKTFPFDAGLALLAEHVKATRNHPSLGMYCLGNEGSQLMAYQEIERQHAAKGYAAIKKHAPHHPAMIAFGMQGELPELANDIESPHLWSHEFRWAYDGLSRIPWGVMQPLAAVKPCIVHEYGKFGVWPDKREQPLYPANGYAAPFGEQGRAALDRAGIGELEETILLNSRRLNAICNRTSIEMARRQPNVDGYVMWTFFRNGARNAGFVDDMGQRPDHDPAIYRERCNAPLAVLIDGDYDRRTVQWGGRLNIGVYLSNFSGAALRGAVIEWQLADDERVVWLGGTIAGIDWADGTNGKAGAIREALPTSDTASKLTLSLRVKQDGETLAANEWSYWAFPGGGLPVGDLIVYDFADEETARHFRARAPEAMRLADYDSMLRGCYAWKGMNAEETIRRLRPRLFVSDRLDALAEALLQDGISVLLLDAGRFPREWHPGAESAMPYEYYRQFTSFRAGWDRGNIATVVHADDLLGDFPHEAMCDVQFYHMVQDARPLRVGVLSQAIGSPCEAIVRSVPRMQTDVSSSVVLQDPNARNEQKKWVMPQIDTEERAYLLRTRVGGGSLVICALRLFDDPAGGYMLAQLLKNAASASA